MNCRDMNGRKAQKLIAQGKFLTDYEWSCVDLPLYDAGGRQYTREDLALVGEAQRVDMLKAQYANPSLKVKEKVPFRVVVLKWEGKYMTVRTQSSAGKIAQRLSKALGEVTVEAVSDDLSLHHADSLAGDEAGRWLHRDAEEVRQEIERIKAGPID